MAMKHCSCNYIPGIRNYFNMGDLGGLIAPRPLVTVCGVNDSIFPIEGVEESFQLIQKGYAQLQKEDLSFFLYVKVCPILQDQDEFLLQGQLLHHKSNPFQF